MGESELVKIIDAKVADGIKRIEEMADAQKDSIRFAGEKAKREAVKETDGAWKPERGDNYWCVVSDGDVGKYVWDNDNIDADHYAIGNCFPTRAIAEHARDCLRWKAAYKRRGRKFIYGMNNDVARWDHENKVIKIQNWMYHDYGLVCFDSNDELYAAIDATCLEMGGTREDFARYVLGVEV